jgi:hypothetical protein
MQDTKPSEKSDSDLEKKIRIHDTANTYIYLFCFTLEKCDKAKFFCFFGGFQNTTLISIPNFQKCSKIGTCVFVLEPNTEILGEKSEPKSNKSTLSMMAKAVGFLVCPATAYICSGFAGARCTGPGWRGRSRKVSLVSCSSIHFYV